MNDRTPDSNRGFSQEQRTPTMEMPLFPLNTVLFPGMPLPLHIFEPRYREMINRCLEENLTFGVVLIREGKEVGDDALPYRVGTTARIVDVERELDGRMNIHTVGLRRFYIEELSYDHAYLTGRVRRYPVINGDTRLAIEQAQRVRPMIIQYVDLLTKATGVQLRVDQLPEDPTRLAFLTAMALQVRPEDKQRLLELPGVPEMLDMGAHFLSREKQLLQYMIRSQSALAGMTYGPTGQLFDN